MSAQREIRELTCRSGCAASVSLRSTRLQAGCDDIYGIYDRQFFKNTNYINYFIIDDVRRHLWRQSSGNATSR